MAESVSIVCTLLRRLVPPLVRSDGALRVREELRLGFELLVLALFELPLWCTVVLTLLVSLEDGRACVLRVERVERRTGAVNSVSFDGFEAAEFLCARARRLLRRTGGGLPAEF